MHKIIRAIREVAAEEAVPLNGAYGEPVEPTEIQGELINSSRLPILQCTNISIYYPHIYLYNRQFTLL